MIDKNHSRKNNTVLLPLEWARLCQAIRLARWAGRLLRVQRYRSENLLGSPLLLRSPSPHDPEAIVADKESKYSHVADRARVGHSLRNRPAEKGYPRDLHEEVFGNTWEADEVQSQGSQKDDQLAKSSHFYLKEQWEFPICATCANFLSLLQIYKKYLQPCKRTWTKISSGQAFLSRNLQPEEPTPVSWALRPTVFFSRPRGPDGGVEDQATLPALISLGVISTFYTPNFPFYRKEMATRCSVFPINLCRDLLPAPGSFPLGKGSEHWWCRAGSIWWRQITATRLPSLS